MNKQPHITDATREVFIDAFCILNKELPIEKITVKLLTEKSGYNRSTFYRYFKDIYDLLDFIETRVINKILAAAHLNFKDWNFNEAFLTTFSDIQAANRKELDILLGSYNGMHFVERLKTSLLELWFEETGCQPTNLHELYRMEFFFSGFTSTMRHWLMRGKDLSAEELGKLIQSIGVVLL